MGGSLLKQTETDGHGRAKAVSSPHSVTVAGSLQTLCAPLHPLFSGHVSEHPFQRKGYLSGRCIFCCLEPVEFSIFTDWYKILGSNLCLTSLSLNGI